LEVFQLFPIIYSDYKVNICQLHALLVLSLGLWKTTGVAATVL